ncbi:FBXO9 family protein [Megaselia abdita]
MEGLKKPLPAGRKKSLTSNLSEPLSEDDDDSSSSPFHMRNNFESALQEFRENWQKEIKTSSQKRPAFKHVSDSHDSIIDESDDEKAERLFKVGIELEQKGKVYDALQYYRRAVQLVPDIEYRIYEISKRQLPLNNGNEMFTSQKNRLSKEPDNNDNDRKEDLEGVNLAHRFKDHLGSNLILSSLDDKVVSTQFHISGLPTEIIFYILKWIISNQLDLHSLEQVSETCKGFYLFARDEDIWKQICKKMWGSRTGSLQETTFSTWREMFIKRERINFNGCYISKTTYLRYGENSFQDEFYRPIQLIMYYRYIRFLSDGKVFMMTNSDEPHVGVNKMKNVHNIRPDVMRGEWRLHGDIVIITCYKNNTNFKPIASRRRGSLIALETTPTVTKYDIEMTIRGTSKKRFCQLQWNKYSLIQKRVNGSETTTDFELSNAKFPPLYFSKVKSYHNEADAPL